MFKKSQYSHNILNQQEWIEINDFAISQSETYKILNENINNEVRFKEII